jgi:hypothetical protein
MSRQRLGNNIRSTLSVAVSSNTQATLTLQTGHGALFPPFGPPDFILVTIDDGTNVEICKCISISGDVLTVLRGFEGTTAQASFATGSKVEARVTRDTFVRLGRTIGYAMAAKPITGTTSWVPWGLPLPTIVGSSQTQTMSNSSWKDTQPKIRYTTTQSAQSAVSWRIPTAICNIEQGFRAFFRFAPHNAPNSSHFFAGLVNTTGAVTSVHPPSSLTNAITVGWANGTQGAELSIWRNDASGAAVQLALGSYFTATSASAYELELIAVGSESRVFYNVRRLDISSIAEASSFFTTDIPPNSAWLSPYMHGCSMVTSAPQFDHLGFIVDVS